VMVLPPTQMASSLKAGLIDGFCVGEPWNSVAVADGAGWVVATSEQILPHHPEKVLLAAGALLGERADEHAAIIRSLSQACAHCDDPFHRASVARLLAESGHLRASRELLARSFVGPFDTGVGQPVPVESFHIFHRDETNRPTLEKARWVARELSAHGSVAPSQAAAVMRLASTAWREDIYREALGASRKGGRAKNFRSTTLQIHHEEPASIV
jgi:ABC-type nitrate/sulfonate/bicarbonate transport system substrate-binding protein